MTSTTPDSNLTNNSDDASVQVPEQIIAPPVPPVVVLPPTGSDGVGTLMPTAAVLLAAGFVMYRISKRRTANQ